MRSVRTTLRSLLFFVFWRGLWKKGPSCFTRTVLFTVGLRLSTRKVPSTAVHWENPSASAVMMAMMEGRRSVVRAIVGSVFTVIAAAVGGIVIVVEVAARDRAALGGTNGGRAGAVAKAFFVIVAAIGDIIMGMMAGGGTVLVGTGGDCTGAVAKPVFVVVATVDPAAVEMAAGERAVRFRADGDAGLYTLDRAVMLSMAVGEDRHGQCRGQNNAG